MAITKPLVTTEVIVHGVNDVIVFEDAVGDDGKVTRDGTNARYQILHGDTVRGMTENGLVEIPYHAVIMASVEVADSEPIEEPEDTFCVSESDAADSEPDNPEPTPGN